MSAGGEDLVMLLSSLPLPTTYDPSADPPGSVDPLGTVAGAEQLADVLLPGLTARMWRARHLTFAALAALVGERAAQAEGGSEVMRLEARLGLERLFVSAVARKDEAKLPGWGPAARRLPGIGLARRAIRADDQPLGKQNFLKGQAINGPFGVVQRLARHLDIIDDENRLSRKGETLLLAWSADQELDGVLDDSTSSSSGAEWLKRLTGRVLKHVKDGHWPGGTWWDTRMLAERLRPGQPGRRETRFLFELLRSDASVFRRRCIDLLLTGEVVAGFAAATKTDSRKTADQTVLFDHVKPRLSGRDQQDKEIGFAIALIDAYEQVSGALEAAFRGLLWALTRRGGRGTAADLLGDTMLTGPLASTRKRLATASARLHAGLADLQAHPHVRESVSAERLDQLLQDARRGESDVRALAESVMTRHVRVQQQKRKGIWIEQDRQYWLLQPGFGDNADSPPSFDGAYLHPYRISNAYSLLKDLGKVQKIKVPDGEEE
ncbi:MAG TPA: hypothetical protein PLV92_04345 [Pirellulaceae bacterium]|nr:hypothetical protein [Pirellulaceae bacterium]